jgi:catechol 2,3-dioxygenase-like lactoylglutathione lyase family enzyme
MSESSLGYAAARAELIASAAHRKGSPVSNQSNDASTIVEENIPYLRVADARAAAAWYRRLGYQAEWEHKFGPDFPTTISVARNGRPGTRLFLSEHTGDATPNTLVYVRVQDVDAIAAEFEAEIQDNGWAREVWLTDLDGNRVRVGTPTPATTPTAEFSYQDLEGEPTQTGG